MKLYVQYGCGLSAPINWKNFDASPTLRFERLPIIGRLYTKNNKRFSENVEYGDIVSGLRLSNNTCAAVYCSHVLEHLSLDEFRLAIKETYRVLAEQGLFRLVLPDLEHAIHAYISNQSSEAVKEFMEETCLGLKQRDRSLTGMIRSWFGNSQHLWMWDYKCIAKELADCGFVTIRRAQLGDSSEPMFKEVEDPSRWKNCLGVECTK